MRRTKGVMIETQVVIEDELDSWAFDSHLWRKAELQREVCQWCGHTISGHHGVDSSDFPLCLENPKVKKMLEEKRFGVK